ncbi:Uu.00g079760.m01.CDS01 [Anthostomella pinea]|uniref:Uu.00g079760.m01.CDS01 n=1 Tax=Anthostomella pinea TaxID=933095 RepID=A0AAI8VM08_9PEZI|nr:Uu.00g079760.m01.CDS01 [Anthostomella pinea]
MVRTRKERKAAGDTKLAQPDRSGPNETTLLQLADERNLFEQAERREKSQRARREGAEEDEEDAPLSPVFERVMETILWSVSLAMLHFTLDVLVQHQYAMRLVWPDIVIRAVQAMIVFFLLFYVLHPHPSSPVLLPGLPLRFQPYLRQTIFLAASIASGCYLVHISTTYGYIAVMKRSPPLGCLWVWSVIELELPLAVASLACTGGFFYQGGYTIKS